MKDIFSAPNLITYARIAFIPLLIYVFFLEIPYKDILAAFIFIILSLSDALDGYIARKHKKITGIGKILDPIADKLLIGTALLLLIERIPVWMIAVIFGREILITVARLILVRKKVIAASMLGKAKTISQIIAIVAVLINAPYSIHILFVAVLITIASGIDYLLKMIKLIDEPVYTIPNAITTIRLGILPFFVIAVASERLDLAVMSFAIIVISDMFDGISARLKSQVTSFGRMYDSSADFIVGVSSYIVLSFSDLLPVLWVYIFLGASISVAITKSIQFMKQKETHSGLIGKLFMGAAYITIFAFLIDFTFKFQIITVVAAFAYVYAVVDGIKAMKLYVKN